MWVAAEGPICFEGSHISFRENSTHVYFLDGFKNNVSTPRLVKRSDCAVIFYDTSVNFVIINNGIRELVKVILLTM